MLNKYVTALAQKIKPTVFIVCRLVFFVVLRLPNPVCSVMQYPGAAERQRRQNQP